MQSHEQNEKRARGREIKKEAFRKGKKHFFLSEFYKSLSTVQKYNSHKMVPALLVTCM